MMGQIQSRVRVLTKNLQIISRSESSNSKDSTSPSQGPTQAEFLTLISKCQTSLATATNLE